MFNSLCVMDPPFVSGHEHKRGAECADSDEAHCRRLLANLFTRLAPPLIS